jgi:transcriptional regulator with XRE-family HTH domain
VNKLRDKKLLARFGKHLKKMWAEANLSQEELANASDMEISQVYRIENGLVNPTLTILKALSNGLNIALAELMHF